MASAVRDSRGHDRAASPRWSTVANFAARGIVIVGMAGAAWALGTATAEAAATEEQASPDSLVTATSSIFDESVSTSEQAARSIQSNQPGSGGSSRIEVAESLVSVLSVAQSPIDEDDRNAVSRGIGGSAGQSPDEESVNDLARDLTRPSTLGGTVRETADPFAGLTDTVSAPLSDTTRSVVTPVSDGVDEADDSVARLLDATAGPLAGREVASMLNPLADTVSLSTPIDADDTGAGQFARTALPTVAADTVAPRPDASADFAVPGFEAADDARSTMGNAFVEGAPNGAQAPESLPQSPRSHIPGVVSGGSTTGNGAASDRGATDAGSACIGYAGQLAAPQVSRVRPDTSTYSRVSELVANPAVSPD